MPTEWQRETRGRVLRTVKESSNFTSALSKKLKKTTDPYLVAAIAKAAADNFETKARELRECVADLGYGGSDE